jgi:hypothetical protein
LSDDIAARIVAEALFSDKKYSCGGATCPNGVNLCCFYCSNVFSCKEVTTGQCIMAIDVDLEEFRLDLIPPECDAREEVDPDDIHVQ